MGRNIYQPTREDQQALVDAVARHGNKEEAAKALGMKAATYKWRLQQAEKAGFVTKIDSPRALKQQIAALKKQVEASVKEQDTADRIRQVVYNLAEHTPEAPKWLKPPARGAGSRGCPMTMWSDWHYGEVVKRDEVGGVNEFNSKIAKERIQRLVSTTIELCHRHMGDAGIEYPGVVVCLGGDMISGDIHLELEVSNDRTPYQCINDLVDIIAGGLAQMADAFGRVFVPCVVGNHGRGTQKPRMKGRVYTSFEWNIYCQLERHFQIKGDKRVTFFVPNETDAYFSVYGHRFLLTHGDSLGVKGGDGIIGSLGPIMRGSIKVSRSEAQIGRDFDTIVMGHWHQYLTLPGVIVNNSLKGYDEFARLALRAPYSRPSQALWFVHPKHGITAHWQVYLEPLRSNGKRAWVEIQK